MGGFLSSIGSWLGKSGLGQTLLKTGAEVGLPLLAGGLMNRGTNKAADQYQQNALQLGSDFAKKAGGYSDQLMGYLPNVMKATGGAMGGAMNNLGGASKFFGSQLTDPQALAEATATTLSDQANQAQSERAQLARMGGRTGIGALLSGKTVGSVRKNAQATRLNQKNVAAGSLGQLGQYFTQLASAGGNLATGLTRGTGELMQGAGSMLGASQGILNANRQQAGQLGNAIGTGVSNIFDYFKKSNSNNSNNSNNYVLQDTLEGLGLGQAPVTSASVPTTLNYG